MSRFLKANLLVVIPRYSVIKRKSLASVSALTSIERRLRFPVGTSSQTRNFWPIGSNSGQMMFRLFMKNKNGLLRSAKHTSDRNNLFKQ
jgi:hypothetical protein